MENGKYKFRVFQFGEDWVCEFPDLPGCSGIGDTPEEAIEDGKVAMALWLETAREEG